MADNAAFLQLPIMLQQKTIWPGLKEAGLYVKAITGDGNCLFASLSDQLYGTPSRHPEIRAKVVEHMRAFRLDYEPFLPKDEDVTMKRATRSTLRSIQENANNDHFEEYMLKLARIGSYGGQPELVAFARAYDQDVVLHTPAGAKLMDQIITNDQRSRDASAKPHIHICYGGDEVRRPHYDSSEKKGKTQAKSLATRTKPMVIQMADAGSAMTQKSPLGTFPSGSPSGNEIATGWRMTIPKEFGFNLNALTDPDRGRSPSVSSQYSTGSKRSCEDDNSDSRSAKRADRKGVHLKSRRAVKRPVPPIGQLKVAHVSRLTSSGPPTPESTQDTNSSSENLPTSAALSSPPSPRAEASSGEDSDCQITSVRPRPAMASFILKSLPSFKRKPSYDSNNSPHQTQTP